MIFKIRAKCGHCNNDSFKMEKKSEGISEDSVIIRETMMHDGFGYDLNTFNIICTKCGKKNSGRFFYEEERKVAKR